jgi:hypothetical protein
MSYLGRMRQGSLCHFAVFTGPVGLLDSEPVASFYADDGTLAAQVPATRLDGVAFRVQTRIDERFGVGRFRLEVRWSVRGQEYAELDYLEVVAGGDAAGTVIALDCRDRPEATYLLAQTDSGLVFQGRNPRV